MFELPKNCYVNKFLPKKIFYEKVGVSSGVKDEFVNLVDRITWLYKLSPDTVGIPKTEKIEEIQIFQIDVKEKQVPLSVIKTITKGVQYKILFLIKYNNENKVEKVLTVAKGTYSIIVKANQNNTVLMGFKRLSLIEDDGEKNGII